MMKSNFMGALLSLTLLALSFSSVAMPRVVGNGGGGVKVNGVYKTFYNAGFFTEAESIEHPAGMDFLVHTLIDMVGNAPSIEILLKSIVPGDDRRYYNVDQSRFDDETYQRLIAEYARVTNQPVGDLTIFAITDAATGSTFLLPSFYQLDELGQAAILFHEGYWVANPKAEYLEVVKAESSFQRYVLGLKQNILDQNFLMIVANLANDRSIPVQAAYAFDLSHGNLKELGEKNGYLPIGLFVDFDDQCTFKSAPPEVPPRSWSKKGVATLDCFMYPSNSTNLQIMNLKRRYPKSYFLEELSKFLMNANSRLQIETMTVVVKSKLDEFNIMDPNNYKWESEADVLERMKKVFSKQWVKFNGLSMEYRGEYRDTKFSLIVKRNQQ